MRLYTDTTGMSADEVRAQTEHVSGYVEKLQSVHGASSYEIPESSIRLPADDQLMDQVTQLVTEKVTLALRYIFVVGIGGSNLGTKAVYDALCGYEDEIGQHDRPRIIFFDTNNSRQVQAYLDGFVSKITSAEECLVVSISKSGGTTETIANTEIVLHALFRQVGDVAARTVVITDEESPFWESAKARHITTLPIPAVVGGRYSVLSAVGLFPLAAAGIDISALRAGASDMCQQCITPEFFDNPALQSAATIAQGWKKGFAIHDTFVFHGELESLGKWYRQLLGESIGKEYDTAGQRVCIGVVPTVSVGSTDLHSVGQLYLGGPNNILTTFVYSSQPTISSAVPEERMFPNIVTMIDGKRTGDIMSAIRKGTQAAYQKSSRPFMRLELDGIIPYEIGAFLQFKMLEMMYLGVLLGVDPFDQPNVESYKKETKRILES